ncbi:hypothetical protein CBL_21446, partial [Carabus blaptoides fortunei]
MYKPVKEKRAREQDTENAFNRSKKILRSPEQRRVEEERKERDSKVKVITENRCNREEEGDMEELKQMMKEVMREMAKNTAELKEEIKELRTEMRKKEEKWEEEKRQLMEKIETLESRAENEERARKVNNIIIKGMKVRKEQVKEEVESFISTELEIKAKIVRAYKIEVPLTFHVP